MRYNLTVIDIDPLDEEDVTIGINGKILRCWMGYSDRRIEVGGKYTGEIFMKSNHKFSMKESQKKVKEVIRLYKVRFDYLVRGILDVDNRTIDAGILLDTESRSEFFDYGYLHDKYIECVISKIELYVHGE